jgi:hypothetical protein
MDLCRSAIRLRCKNFITIQPDVQSDKFESAELLYLYESLDAYRPRSAVRVSSTLAFERTINAMRVAISASPSNGCCQTNTENSHYWVTKQRSGSPSRRSWAGEATALRGRSWRVPSGSGLCHHSSDRRGVRQWPAEQNPEKPEEWDSTKRRFEYHPNGGLDEDHQRNDRG